MGGLVAPLFQKEFVDKVLHDPLAPPLQHALGFVHQLTGLQCLFLSAAFLVLHFSFYQIMAWVGNREAILLQQKWAMRLYLKVLSTPLLRKNKNQVGEFVTAYTTDIPGATILIEQSIPQGTSILFPFLLTPFLLHQFFEIPLGISYLTLIGLTLVNILLAYRQSLFFYLFKRLASDRIALVSEWIQSLKTLRILGWMPLFEERIFHVRRVETANRLEMLTNGQTMNSLSTTATFFLNLAVLAYVFLLSRQPTTAGEVLSILWIIGIFLTRSFRQLPWFLTYIFDAWTSIQRLGGLLESLDQAQDAGRIPSPMEQKENASPFPALLVRNLNLNIGGETILRNLNFSISAGEHVALVGEVGAGKSMTLLSLLRETGAEFESFQVFGNKTDAMSSAEVRSFFGYVPQESFVMNASLRENIWFSYTSPSTEDEKLEAILTSVNLDLKKSQMPAGLNTPFGERGVNLSGGQRQRLSLARVLFHDRPILLLDDIFSALDDHTESELIGNLFFGDWKAKTILLATQRLSVLPHMDRIFFFKKGEIVAQGSFSQLLSSSAEFSEFVQSLRLSEKTPEIVKEKGIE